MSVWGIAMCKNEADIIGPIVAHMVGQVDHVLIADNLSTDETPDILAASGAEVIVDDDPAYRQSEKMTALAQRARDGGATWVVPFDADEWWYSPHGRIADVLAGLSDSAIATAAMYDHVPTLVDPIDDNPITRIGWRRRDHGVFPKVACRTGDSLVVQQGNHGAVYNNGLTPNVIADQLVIRHYPYRTREQFVAKAKQGAAALRLTRLPRSSGLHWRQYAEIAERDGDEALAAVFDNWFHSDDPAANPALIFDPAPQP